MRENWVYFNKEVLKMRLRNFTDKTSEKISI